MVETGEKNKIVSLRFNQDQACFVCGTEKGFQIYNSLPYKDTFTRDFGGGLGVVEMLFKSNILALVGGGTHPKYPLNKVMLWDDYQTKCIGELSFKTPVKTVKMRKDILVVVLEARIYVYNFTDLKLIDGIDTCGNVKGVCALSAKDSAILVSPNKSVGEMCIKNYGKGETKNMKAHKAMLSAIELNSEGTICATASTTGTLIRVFSTEDGKQIKELRRGKDHADIQSIAFDPSSRLLACFSDKGTVHIFSIGSKESVAVQAVGENDMVPQGIGEREEPQENKKEEEKKEEEKKQEEKKVKEKEKDKKADPRNPTSMFRFMKGVVPYFKSEWSFAQFRIPDQHAVVAFGPEDQSTIIGRTSSLTFRSRYLLGEILRC